MSQKLQRRHLHSAGGVTLGSSIERRRSSSVALHTGLSLNRDQMVLAILSESTQFNGIDLLSSGGR